MSWCKLDLLVEDRVIFGDANLLAQRLLLLTCMLLLEQKLRSRFVKGVPEHKVKEPHSSTTVLVRIKI